MDAAEYKGLCVQQHANAFAVFSWFFREVRPATVCEIGTADGGWALFLRDLLDDCGLVSSRLVSYDIHRQESHKILLERGIEVRIEDIFIGQSILPEKLPEIQGLIQAPGTAIVLCDGGNKAGECAAIAPLLKSRDFILAHDYVKSEEEFNRRFKGKIWDWCEVDEVALKAACEANNLKDYHPETFADVVWACKRKS